MSQGANAAIITPQTTVTKLKKSVPVKSNTELAASSLRKLKTDE